MDLKIKWNTSEGFFEIMAKKLPMQGVNFRRGLGITDPVTGSVMLIAATVLCDLIYNLFKDMRYSGLIIDATKSPIEIRDMPNWDRSQILIITDKGIQMHQFCQDKNGAADLMKVLEQLGE